MGRYVSTALIIIALVMSVMIVLGIGSHNLPHNALAIAVLFISIALLWDR